MKILLLLLFSTVLSTCAAMPLVNNFFLSEHKDIGAIQILSSKTLNFTGDKDLPFEGISDLAWDEKQQILYALSDRAGLFHLKIDYQEEQIKAVSIIAAYPLKNIQGEALVSDAADSEGLTLRYNQQGETILEVAFEQDPRIIQYSPQGKWLAESTLPKALQNIYHYRSTNKALESVVYHPEHGLLTASEYPLKKYSMHTQRIYSLKSGREWLVPASAAKNSAITALSILPNNNILRLERAWAGFLHPLVITLSEVMINDCPQGKICSVKKLAKLSTADSWRLDNFEGLTRFKNDHYFMISDDNAKPIQNTILVLFKLKK